MIRDDAFLEYADVFGNYYGTGRADTDALLSDGHDVVLVIDVQGARQVRGRGIETVGIFVLPPSSEVLERRLRGRSTCPREPRWRGRSSTRTCRRTGPRLPTCRARGCPQPSS